MKALTSRLILMNFLEFAVWGAYLTSMGAFLANAGFGQSIWLFYAMQGIVSIFMPALMGIVADRWIPAQRLLGLCHLFAGIFMVAAGLYGSAAHPQFGLVFGAYSLSVAFFMPTIALTNSVAFIALTRAGRDTVKAFPPIRVFGTVGFICTMWAVDLLGFQNNANQFIVSGALSVLLALYAQSLPACPISRGEKSTSLVKALGLDAFALFRQKRMAIFFIFSMLLGVSLQITNGYANTYIQSFNGVAEYATTFGVQHANILISLSQISETCCILLIPICLKRFGIKKVMMISMLAWVLRFGLFGTGNPGPGVWMFILSCIVYGVAFDFFNISGALFVDQNTDEGIRSSAQGLFMLMTNGLGATLGTVVAGRVINHYVYDLPATPVEPVIAGWRTSWFLFAAYALVVLILFAILFKEKSKK